MKLNRTASNWTEFERNKINENWDRIEGLGTAVDNLVLESSGDSNAEVIQARGTFPVLNDRLINVESDLNNIETLVNGLEISKVDKSQLHRELVDIRKSIDDIIATPSEGVSEQEIIDARMGRDSLGTNIREIAYNQETFYYNKIYNGNFTLDSLNDYLFFHGTGVLSSNVPGYSRNDLLILTSSGVGHNYFGATAAYPLKNQIPSDEIWYIKARARSVSDDAVRFRLGFRGESGIIDTEINPVEKNKWYDLSYYFDPSETTHSLTGEFRSSLFFTYPTGAQSGKVVEVDNWLAINLTETFGKGNEPTKEQMDDLLKYFPNRYFGQRDVGALASANSKRLTFVENEVQDKLTRFEGVIEKVVNHSEDALIENIVDNGDFSNTAGGKWRTQNSTWNISNNTLTLIGTGNSPMPAIVQDLGVPFARGNKIYVRTDLKPKNSDFTRLVLMTYSSDGGDSIRYFYINNAETGVKQSHSNVFDLAETGSGNLFLQIRAQYPSAQDSQGKEVDINNVLVINLTETFGKGNEPTKEQMDEIVNNLPNQWFDDKPKVSEVQKSFMSYVFNKKDKGGVGLKRPLIAVTFDDGFRSDIDLVYPEFKARNIVGTSYIWTDRTDNYAGAMDHEDLIKLKLNGWGIECHTRDHLRLAELSDQEIHEQFQAVNQDFERYGLPLPQHHALPFGSGGNVKRVQDIVMQYRKSCRNIHSNSSGIYNDWDTIDFRALNARSADITDANPHVVDLRKSDIDLTIEENGILILIVHKVLPETSGQYEAKLEHLLSVVDYAIEKGMKFVTLDEMYERVKEYQNVVN